MNALNRTVIARLAGEAFVSVLDACALFDRVGAEPAGIKLTNVTSACGAVTTPNCDPSGVVFRDGDHPNSADAIAAAVVPEPGQAWLLLVGVGGLVELGGLSAWQRCRV